MPLKRNGASPAAQLPVRSDIGHWGKNKLIPWLRVSCHLPLILAPDGIALFRIHTLFAAVTFYVSMPVQKSETKETDDKWLLFPGYCHDKIDLLITSWH